MSFERIQIKTIKPTNFVKHILYLLTYEKNSKYKGDINRCYISSPFFFLYFVLEILAPC